LTLSKPLVLCVLAPFLAFSAWCAATGGGFGEVLTAFGANPWIAQVSLDLCIALGLVCVWMWRDARARAANPLPWIVATLFTGSIAPLAYLLFRPTGGDDR
jgi:cytochrome bd-type quinol oxidase subunit 2